MTVTVETLEKLERKMTLTLAADTIENEVNQRLKRLARQVKIDGFRPGKDRKSTRLNSSHSQQSRMPSSA